MRANEPEVPPVEMLRTYGEQGMADVIDLARRRKPLSKREMTPEEWKEANTWANYYG